MRTLLLIAASAVALLLGCSADTSARRCATAADCNADQRCQSGTCFDACRTLEDCSPFEYCGGGLCLDRPPCATRADCPSGFVCETRTCVPQTPECERDRDCPPNFTCSDGGCIPPGIDPSLECITARDCAEGERCIDNVCSPNDPRPDAGPTDGQDDPVVPGQDPIDPRPDLPPSPDIPIVPDTTPAPETGPSPDVSTEPETTPDVEPDIPVEPDVEPDLAPECRSIVDCPVGFECEGGACIEIDPCEGRQPGQYTDRCVARDECCSGLCLGNVAVGQGYCTQRCESWNQCNPIGIVTDDYNCLDIGGGDRVCARSDFGRTCASASACIDQKCLQAITRLVGATSSCSHSCRTGADCGPGLACGRVPFNVGGSVQQLNVCLPVGEPCAGRPTDCFSSVCLSDVNITPGVTTQYCSAYCNLADNTACPDGWACVSVGVDAVCARLP